jgi:hypothetical protein
LSGGCVDEVENTYFVFAFSFFVVNGGASEIESVFEEFDGV